MAKLAPPGINIAHRIISEHDEQALLPPELAALEGRSALIRRQSGAARIAARQLLSRFGLGDAPLPRGPSGAPIWPPGIVGSLAHNRTTAVAAVGRNERFDALGIDLEGKAKLPVELISVVATPKEQARYPASLLETRVLFAIKEAIFKALHPVTGLFLDFHDIEVDIGGHVGTTRHGHAVHFDWIVQPKVVAIAFLAAQAA